MDLRKRRLRLPAEADVKASAPHAYQGGFDSVVETVEVASISLYDLIHSSWSITRRFT